MTKLVSDEDKYKLGKTKIFFRAGQVAYMEKLRSEKLRACGVMIQKHVKMWLYRKRYLQKQKAALTIQVCYTTNRFFHDMSNHFIFN